MEDFGFVFNRMITERNPPRHQELETLSASSPVDPLLEESTGCEEDVTDCDEGASGAPTNTWTKRGGVVFTLMLYSVSAVINF
jgi:hypothetical protein